MPAAADIRFPERARTTGIYLVSMAEVDDGDEDEMPSVCVALEFEGVLSKLEEPAESLGDIEVWAEWVGVVSEKPQHVVNGFCAKREIHVDFFPGPKSGKMETLRRAREEMGIDADRYIYVGSSKRDEVMAEKQGWEYMSREEVADDVGWSFDDG